MADQREDEILRGHAEWQPPLEGHAHGFRPALNDGLRGQHMRQLARPDTERQRAQPAMGTGMAVAAYDQAAGKAQAQFRSDDVDDALAGLIDIEHLDTNSGCFGPQACQQLLPDLAGAGPAARRRNRVIGRREGQLRIMDCQIAALEIEQPARAAEIVQQMAIDMEEIGIVANPGNNMLIPNLGQQRTTVLFQQPVLPFGLMAGGQPSPAAVSRAWSASAILAIKA